MNKMEVCQNGNGTDLKSDVTYPFVEYVRLLQPPLTLINNMSNGKKWKTASKYVGKRSHGRRWTYRVCGGKSGKCRFQHFRHQKWFKALEGKISMRRAMAREIWFWD